jgi:hypothetical protein
MEVDVQKFTCAQLPGIYLDTLTRWTRGIKDEKESKSKAAR